MRLRDQGVPDSRLWPALLLRRPQVSPRLRQVSQWKSKIRVLRRLKVHVMQLPAGFGLYAFQKWLQLYPHFEFRGDYLPVPGQGAEMRSSLLAWPSALPSTELRTRIKAHQQDLIVK